VPQCEVVAVAGAKHLFVGYTERVLDEVVARVAPGCRPLPQTYVAGLTPPGSYARRMRSELFGQNLETTSSEVLSLQNPRMLKARLQDSELLARQGAMVAYQGAVEFAYEGAGGVGAS
jgi:hypothetical protein